MTTRTSATTGAASATRRDPALTILRLLLLLEALAGLVLTIFLSLVASGVGIGLSDPEAETSIRFVAGSVFIFAILAALASRAVRRRRGFAWTLSALLQVIAAVGTALAVFFAEWHPLMAVGFVLPVLVMLVLSLGAVREALGQG